MKRGATKEEIIRITQELITRNGIRAVRVDEIAQTLGISKRTLYEMFADKEDLVSACLDFMCHQQQERITAYRKRRSRSSLQRAFKLVYEYIDFGTHSTASVDYPDMALPACDAVVSGQCSKALLFCGTGVGISMAANKVKGIRACCCSDSFSCEYTRRHNDANALCMGGRVVGPGLACQLVDIFLNTEFEGGRHEKRIAKLMAIENR